MSRLRWTPWGDDHWVLVQRLGAEPAARISYVADMRGYQWVTDADWGFADTRLGAQRAARKALRKQAEEAE